MTDQTAAAASGAGTTAAPLAARRPFGRGGLTVGPLGFGAAPIANLGRTVSEEDARAAVETAWEAGVRYYDTAPHYGVGLAEERLGRVLAGKPRDEFVLSTKVGRVLELNPGGPRHDDEGFDVLSPLVRRLDYSRDGVLRSIEDSLTRLGLDRIDVVFVHDPDDFESEALEGAFPALEELRSQGVITSYGAGMNQSEMLSRFVRETDLDIVMCAGRYSLLEQGALADLLPEAERRGVSVVAAAVFNSGLLARARPAATATYNYAPAPAALLERANRIADVCESFGVTLPAAALQYPLRHPAVPTVCVGARDAAQMARNAALFDTPVPESLWAALQDAGLLSS
ncbi:aldo/keto reductase [Herbiconiux sp.]|uniref:aldo/keto reductase n=1 Tax=Herbiconiux sp. TaxID=1871186 RepID=UPI0025BE6722|nr:aldo/keto reductase [Herbiconiux sp.]